MIQKIGTAEPIIKKINSGNIVSKEDNTDASKTTKKDEKDKPNE